MRNELKMFPLKLYGNKMKEKESERYLGDIIHGGGVSESAANTVNLRYGKLIHGIKEIKAIQSLQPGASGSSSSLNKWYSTKFRVFSTSTKTCEKKNKTRKKKF